MHISALESNVPEERRDHSRIGHSLHHVEVGFGMIREFVTVTNAILFQCCSSHHSNTRWKLRFVFERLSFSPPVAQGGLTARAEQIQLSRVCFPMLETRDMFR